MKKTTLSEIKKIISTEGGARTVEIKENRVNKEMLDVIAVGYSPNILNPSHSFSSVVTLFEACK